MRKLILIISVLFFPDSLLFSQTKFLTYEEVVSIALENNITIKKQKNNLKISQAEKQQTLANFLPGVGADGSGYRTDGRQWSDDAVAMVNESIDRASYGIGANMTFFNGFKNVNKLKQSNNLLEAQEEQVEQSNQDIIYLVSQQFLQILLDQELVLIVEQDVEVQSKLYEQLEAYVKTGARTRAELLSQKAQLRTSEVKLLSGKNKLQNDKSSLAKTLLLDTDKEFELLQSDWNVDSILNICYNVDSLYQFAINQRSELKILQAEGKANQNGVAISRAGYMPNLSVYYNYDSYFSSNSTRDNQTIAFDDQMFRENYSHRYGFNISVPIFNRLETRTNIVRSKIAYDNSQLTLLDFKMQLHIDIQNAYQDFISLKETYLANRIRAEASQLAYEKQNEMYQMGQGSLIDLNTENSRKIEAQSEEAQAKYNLVFQEIILDYHIGNLKQIDSID